MGTHFRRNGKKSPFSFFLFKNEMEFRLCLILSLCLMANGLPNETKTGAQLRASDNALSASTSFPVRLIHGASGIIGGKSRRLEVYMGGQWGTVCDDYDDHQGRGNDQHNNNVALVVCRMLGLAGGRVVVSNVDQQFGSFYADPVLATNVQCLGNEVDISKCRMTWYGTQSRCPHVDDLGIVCD